MNTTEEDAGTHHNALSKKLDTRPELADSNVVEKKIACHIMPNCAPLQKKVTALRAARLAVHK